MTAAVNPDFWRGKRVFLTGHTGFKGGWLALWLQRLGAQVTALALPPSTEPSLFAAAKIAQACDSSFIDIRDAAHANRSGDHFGRGIDDITQIAATDWIDPLTVDVKLMIFTQSASLKL